MNRTTKTLAAALLAFGLIGGVTAPVVGSASASHAVRAKPLDSVWD